MKASADLGWIEVDNYVARFEQAWNSGVVPALRNYLTPPEHPQARDVLVELIRVDLECRSERQMPRSLDDYLIEFPECAADAASLNAVAFEDFRMRRRAGAPCTPHDYESRYGCDIDGWPRSEIAAASDGRALSTFVEIRHRENQVGVEFPEAGAFFAGFELIRELGRGAFSRVFLAKQGELAGRQVVLKISTLGFVESDRLARLQHAHIVPVYSVHHCGRFSVVCMPYFGEATLANLLEAIRGSGSFPTNASIIEATAECRLGSAAPPPERKPNTSASSFVTGILRLAADTADGLAFAHQRGILHRDLKPANVLLSEDCRPMLLDFNLSDDLEDRERTDPMIGGTLPYMAPEQLQAYVARRESRDPRSDLFSFGVVFYELLTGHHPLPLRRKSSAEAIAMMEAREWPTVVAVQKWNRGATPAVNAIVQRCLARRPEDRYAHAAELGEDLRRQLADLPLRFASDASVQERVRKWSRRHPRLMSAASVSLLATVLLGISGSALALRSQHLAELQAETQRREFAAGFQSLQAKSVSLNGSDAAAYQELVRDGRELLGGLHVWSDVKWWTHEINRRHSEDQILRMRSDVGEILFLMSAAARTRATSEANPERRCMVESNARDWLSRSEACFAGIPTPRAFTLFNDGQSEPTPETEARRRKLLDDLYSDTNDDFAIRDSGLAATILLLEQRPREALLHWQRICRADPGLLWGQYGLGYCYERLKLFPHALACYSACIALDDNFTDAYFRRGICYLRAKEHEFARADLDAVLSRSPERREARLNRAVALLGLERYGDADKDLEELLARSSEDVRARLIKAAMYERQGKSTEARRLRLDVMSQEIADADTLVARGVAQAETAPDRSLADFEAALRQDASHLAALESKAHVLSEKRGDNSAALEVLNRAVATHPEEATLRAARGVLFARCGKQEAALSDARKALEIEPSDNVRYQVAGIHAILGANDPSEVKVALGLLAGALRHGYGLDLLEKDPDLATLRSQPEFSALKSAAVTLQEAETRIRRGR